MPPLFLIQILLLAILPAYPALHDSPNEDYFSIGAHLNADSFGKHLRKWLESRLQVDALREHLGKSKWDSSTLNLEVVMELSAKIDHRIRELEEALPELASPMTGSYVSCHSIHELIRLSPTQPCAIRVSDTGTPPKYKLDSLLHPLVHRQFVLSDDVLFEFPAEFLPPRIHSGPVVATLLPFKKNVVLLLDTGSLTTQEQVDTVRLVANQLLEVVSFRDHFSVWLTSGSAVQPLSCNSVDLLKGGRQSLDEIKQAIHNLEPPGISQSTKHGQVLSKLVTLLNESDSHGGSTILTYISRGVLENLEDAATSVRQVSDAVALSTNPIRINTLLLVEDRRSTSVWSSQFMENLARRNTSSDDKNYVEGLSLAVEKNLLLDMYDVQELLDWMEATPTEEIVVSLPTSSSRTIVLTKYFFKNASDWVVGVEVPLPALLSSTFHNSSLNLPGIQVHLVTEEGLIIASSAGWEDVPLSVVDNWYPSSKWLETSWEGSGGDLEVLSKENKTVYYTWAKLKRIPFILIVSSDLPFPRTKNYPAATRGGPARHLKHLLPHESVKDSLMRCSQHGKEIIPSTAALYFPPYLSSRPVTEHWLYLTDTLGVLASRGLKKGTRELVEILNFLAGRWATFNKMDENIILQKFMATSEGVLIVYPAAEITKKFDPKRQEWYKEAVNKPGTVVITGPRQDPTLGDVVTLSFALQHRKEVFAVLGIEIPSSFLGKLLKESITSCMDSRQCVLFSRQGKVVFSDKVYPNSDVVERFHVSHLEPLLTSDMTANQKFVKKTLCQYGTVTKRQFEWDVDYTRVHTTPCGDARRGGSVASEVLVVPGSQFLLAMVNTSCVRTPVTVFCPCSVHDGRCLFCGKFDSLECECPCTCPGCVDRQLPFCPIGANNDQMTVTSGIKDVAACSRADRCSSQLQQDACISSAGCSWCQFSSTMQPLVHPQCRPTSSCYGGMAGRSPIKSSDTIQQSKWLTPMPVGPLIAGVLLSLIMLIGAAWCYRNYVRRLMISNCNHSVDSAPLFGPSAEMECDPTVFKEERISQPVLPVQLAFFEKEVLQVPPPPQSDHGYSTMTERNDDTTSAVSTTLTDHLSSVASKPARQLDLSLPPMTSLITMAEVQEEPIPQLRSVY